MPNTAPGATHACYVCHADLTPDEVTFRSTDGQPGTVPVHMVDAGPGHHELEVHRAHEGARYGVRYSTLTPAATRSGPVSVANPPAPAGVIIDTDVSQWQGRPYDTSYTRRFARYRLTLGMTITDTFGARNTAFCHTNAGPGKQLLGHCGYHVWYPGNEAGQATRFLAAAALDPWFVAEIDVESWGGAIKGDHSAQITTLADLLADRLSTARVKIYGNSNDLATIAPHVPAKYGRVKAGYSSRAPGEPWDGWQYTDGATNWPVITGWPRSSAPFGNCDHNAFYGTEAQFQAVYGITPPVVKPPAPTPTPAPVKPVTPTPTPVPAPVPTPNRQIPLEESMKTLLNVDLATNPKGVTYRGVYLQGSDLKLHHVVDPASHAAYLKAGIPEVTITYAEYAAYLKQGLIYA